MTHLDSLVRTDAPIVVDLIDAHQKRCRATMPTAELAAPWNNNPSWDNWKKGNPSPFDNKPAWDNWKKK